jgi:hypothetical protein
MMYYMIAEQSDLTAFDRLRCSRRIRSLDKLRELIHSVLTQDGTVQPSSSVQYLAGIL